MVRRMTPALFAALLVLSKPPAKDQDDPPAPEQTCEVDPKALRPQFAAKLPKGFKLVSTRKAKRTLTQVLKLPDGFEVTLTLGGCEHLGFRFDLKGGTLTPKTVGAELVAVSRRVLPSLPMAKDAFATPATILKALEDSTISQLPATLPCGEATCQLAIAAEPEKPKGKAPKKGAPPQEPAGILSLTYDFPL